MSGKSLIYFDNAATSYPKPPQVVEAAMRAFSECGGNPGRSSHLLSRNAAQAVFECREAVCELLGTNSPENVVFTQNTTHALNLAIKGIVKPGSHVLVSNLEHNSVIRPLHAMGQNSVNYSFFDATGNGDEYVVKSFENGIRKSTTTAVITLASNTCGRILPIERIAQICKAKGIALIVDGAQALGETPVNFGDLGADIICAPGHKGLLGPTGTGFLVVAQNSKYQTKIETLIQGGNGVNSSLFSMPDELPERLESGTLNTVGIAGLAAGINYVKKVGVKNIFEKNAHLYKRLCDGLGNIHGVSLYGNNDDSLHVPVALFNIGKFSSDQVAAMLDEQGFCVRSGLHCAPMAHRAFGTSGSGAVRASLGFENTERQVDKFLYAVNKISESSN